MPLTCERRESESALARKGKGRNETNGKGLRDLLLLLLLLPRRVPHLLHHLLLHHHLLLLLLLRLLLLMVLLLLVALVVRLLNRHARRRLCHTRRAVSQRDVVLVRVNGLLLLGGGRCLRLLVEGLTLLSRWRLGLVAVDFGEDGTRGAADGGGMLLWRQVLRLSRGSRLSSVRVGRGGSVRVVGVLVVVGLERFGEGRRERLPVLLVRLLLILVLVLHDLGDGRR